VRFLGNEWLLRASLLILRDLLALLLTGLGLLMLVFRLLYT